MTVNRERLKVWREVTSLDLELVSLSDVIDTLQRYREEYGDATRIEKEFYQYDDGYYWAVMQERDETDVEMLTRINQEEQREAWQTEHDRREFERLVAKFGG